MTVRTGQEAPDFTLKNQHGQDVSLSQFRGARSVVVLFYPFAFSDVCTGELREVRDRLSGLTAGGAEVLAVSCDPMFSLRAYADRDGFAFSLLSDFWPHGQVASAYGVLDAERGCAARGTFIVDPDGVVRWKVENGLSDARDLQTYLDALEAIRTRSGESWYPA